VDRPREEQGSDVGRGPWMGPEITPAQMDKATVRWPEEIGHREGPYGANDR